MTMEHNAGQDGKGKVYNKRKHCDIQCTVPYTTPTCACKGVRCKSPGCERERERGDTGRGDIVKNKKQLDQVSLTSLLISGDFAS